MHLQAILNADGGTLRSVDLEDYRNQIEDLFAEAGHRLETKIVRGKDIQNAMEAAFANDRSEAVIVAGGDGTVSTAGAMAWKSGKPVGIIPAGTLNLFARSLEMPMEIVEAARALATSKVVKGDIATANGRPFLHHYSVGLQPRIVQLRKRRQYSSRLGKVVASIAAAIDSMRRPPAFPVEIDVDGSRRSMELSTFAVSNNPFGERHLPYADDISAGKLGLYCAGPASNAAVTRMIADLVLGTWQTNPDVEHETADQITVSFPKRHGRAKAAVDGELVDLPKEIEFEIHRGELKLLTPEKSD